MAMHCNVFEVMLEMCNVTNSALQIMVMECDTFQNLKEKFTLQK